MSSWKECKLGECIEVINGYAFKSQNFLEEQIENSLPVVKIKNVANGDVNLKAVQFHLFDKNLEKYLIQKNDVLIALTGNHPQAITQVVGEVSKYKLGELAFLNQRVAKIKARENMSNDFLYYFLKDDASHDYLASQSSGSANQANISKSDIENMPISLPPLEEQKAIAEVLSSLDDKIDLLHRQNQTLESLAQTLFRQWFIEEVKEEWEEVLITDLFEVRDGTHDSPKQKEFGKKLLTSKHILKNKLDFESSYFISEEDFEKINQRSIVEQGDILFSMIGTIGLTYLEQSNEIDYAIKNIGLFKTSQNKKFMYFVYLWLNSSFGVEFIHENRSGSTQEYISLGSLRNIIFNLPNYKIIDLFNEKMEPIFEKINTNMKQIKSLENLRDTLLPKLLSGEISVKR